jgi:hypothetical protein
VLRAKTGAIATQVSCRTAVGVLHWIPFWQCAKSNRVAWWLLHTKHNKVYVCVPGPDTTNMRPKGRGYAAHTMLRTLQLTTQSNTWSLHKVTPGFLPERQCVQVSRCSTTANTCTDSISKSALLILMAAANPDPVPTKPDAQMASVAGNNLIQAAKLSVQEEYKTPPSPPSTAMMLPGDVATGHDMVITAKIRHLRIHSLCIPHLTVHSPHLAVHTLHMAVHSPYLAVHSAYCNVNPQLWQLHRVCTAPTHAQ